MASGQKSEHKLYYGWIMVAGACAIVCMLLGIRNSFGVFFPSIQAEFGTARAATSGIFSLFLIVTSAASLINGLALDRWSPRTVFSIMAVLAGLGLVLTGQTRQFWQIYLSYGLVVAFGMGGTIPLTASIVSRWFDKNRGLAIAIATSGAGLGSLLISPFAGCLVTSLEWRTAYLILGIICTVIVAGIASFMKKAPSRPLPETPAGGVERQQSGESGDAAGLTLAQALRTGNFWLIVAFSFLFAASTFMFITHIVPHAVDAGIPTVQASTLLSILGGVSIAGRLAAGRVADIMGTKKPAIAFAIIGAASFLVLIASDQLWALSLAAALYGLCWGGFGVTLLSLISAIFGNRNIGGIMGASDISYAVGSAAGSTLAGYIFDVRASYTLAFMLGALFLVLAVPLVAAVVRRRVSKNT